jgi:hypothetical protein
MMIEFQWISAMLNRALLTAESPTQGEDCAPKCLLFSAGRFQSPDEI